MNVGNATRMFCLTPKFLRVIRRAATYEQAWDLWRSPEVREVLKHRFYDLACMTHPDLGGDSESFVGIKDAYRFVLSEAFVKQVWLASEQKRQRVKQTAVAIENSVYRGDWGKSVYAMVRKREGT